MSRNPRPPFKTDDVVWALVGTTRGTTLTPGIVIDCRNLSDPAIPPRWRVSVQLGDGEVKEYNAADGYVTAYDQPWADDARVPQGVAPDVRDLIPSDDPRDRIRRAVCDKQGHPARTWNPMLDRTFCSCGRHQYPGQHVATSSVATQR